MVCVCLVDNVGLDGGGIGLAAPQVGESVRLAIIEIPGGASRYGELTPMPLTVFVNPEIEILDPAVAGYWEGCLSVPGLRGFVGSRSSGQCGGDCRFIPLVKGKCYPSEIFTKPQKKRSTNGC